MSKIEVNLNKFYSNSFYNVPSGTEKEEILVQEMTGKNLMKGG